MPQNPERRQIRVRRARTKARSLPRLVTLCFCRHEEIRSETTFKTIVSSRLHGRISPARSHEAPRPSSLYIAVGLLPTLAFACTLVSRVSAWRVKIRTTLRLVLRSARFLRLSSRFVGELRRRPAVARKCSQCSRFAIALPRLSHFSARTGPRDNRPAVFAPIRRLRRRVPHFIQPLTSTY